MPSMALMPCWPSAGFWEETVTVATVARFGGTMGVTRRFVVIVDPAKLADNVTVIGERTDWVVTVKLAEVEPASTVTFAGTEATELLLDRETTEPPAGAGPVRVTVPVAEAPPPTVVGFTANDNSVIGGGMTVNVAFRVWPPSEPEMMTSVEEATKLALTGKVAVLDPGETVTVAGTVAAEVLLLESVNTAPLVATVLSVTVAVEEPPLATLVGFRDREDMEMVFEAPWLTVTKALFLMLPPWPSLMVRVIVATVVAATCGGLKVTLDPEPVILPASAVQV